MVFSWSPSSPRTLQQRGRLSAPPFTSSILTTNITLEQISLSPCGSGSRSAHGDTIASLWRVGTEVLPVAHYLPPDQFSWMTPLRAAGDMDIQRRYPAHVVSLGPAERHADWRQGDQVFDQAVVSNTRTSRGDETGRDSMVYRWNAMGDVMQPMSGSGVNVEIDMHYLRVRVFLPATQSSQVYLVCF